MWLANEDNKNKHVIDQCVAMCYYYYKIDKFTKLMIIIKFQFMVNQVYFYRHKNEYTIYTLR